MGTRFTRISVVARVRRVNAGNWSESYQYDGSGNVTLGAVTAGEPVAGSGSGDAFGAGPSGSCAVEPGAREYAGSLVTRVGRSSFRYDSDGRLITRTRSMLSTKAEVTQFGYNSQDRMVWALTPSGERWTYTYDPLGRRVRKQRLDAGGNVLAQTVFEWDGARLAQEITNSGGVGGGRVRSWKYEPGTFTPITQRTQPVSGKIGGDWSKDRVDQQFQVIVSDLVGTPTELVSPDGREVLWSNKTRTIWGATILTDPGADLDCPIRFAGQYEDTETGLFYNLNRYYDPTTNRYTTADPLGFAPAPDAYNYVRNPTGWLDPLGLTPCSDAADAAQPGRHARGQFTGENPQASNGRRAHANYENAVEPHPANQFNQQIPDGTRPDMHNRETREVRELKPDTPSGRAQGRRQLNGYLETLNREFPGEPWTGYLDLHTP